MKRNDNRRFSRYVSLWRAILIFSIGGFMVALQPAHASGTEEGKENMAYKTKIQSPGLPPIDKAASTIIETATFGLG